MFSLVNYLKYKIILLLSSNYRVYKQSNMGNCLKQTDFNCDHCIEVWQFNIDATGVNCFWKMCCDSFFCNKTNSLIKFFVCHILYSAILKNLKYCCWNLKKFTDNDSYLSIYADKTRPRSVNGVESLILNNNWTRANFLSIVLKICLIWKSQKERFCLILIKPYSDRFKYNFSMDRQTSAYTNYWLFKWDCFKINKKDRVEFVTATVVNVFAFLWIVKWFLI